jgi:hypothetical protein
MDWVEVAEVRHTFYNISNLYDLFKNAVGPPVVCTSAHVLFTLFVCFFLRIVVSNRYCVVWFFFVLAL